MYQTNVYASFTYFLYLHEKHTTRFERKRHLTIACIAYQASRPRANTSRLIQIKRSNFPVAQASSVPHESERPHWYAAGVLRFASSLEPGGHLSRRSSSLSAGESGAECAPMAARWVRIGERFVKWWQMPCPKKGFGQKSPDCDASELPLLV